MLGKLVMVKIRPDMAGANGGGLARDNTGDCGASRNGKKRVAYLLSRKPTWKLAEAIP